MSTLTLPQVHQERKETESKCNFTVLSKAFYGILFLQNKVTAIHDSHDEGPEERSVKDIVHVSDSCLLMWHYLLLVVSEAW